MLNKGRMMSFFKNRDQEILAGLKKLEQHVQNDLERYVKPIADLLKDLSKKFTTVNENVTDLNQQFQNLAINHLADRIQNDVRFQAKVLGKKEGYKKGEPLCNFTDIPIDKDLKTDIKFAPVPHIKKSKWLAKPKKNKYARYTKEQKAKIFALLDAGQKPTPIAKKLNIPVSYVYYMQKENSKKKDTNGTGKAS
jgi:hypothetical protein